MGQDLLVDLHRRGIRLRRSGEALEVVAPPGALTADLRAQLHARRDELLELLGRAQRQEPAALVPDAAARLEPFPLTDIQHAYWVGQDRAYDLGGVSTHFYFELERSGLEVDRLQRALQRVVARHDMLRAVVLPDGRQQVLAEVPAYELVVEDLGELPPDAQADRIALVRQAMDHQVLQPDRWPLFDIRVSLLGGGRTRLHVSLSLLVLDAASIYLFFEQWRRFYTEPEGALRPLELTFRDHVLAEQGRSEDDRHRAAEDYWQARAGQLPPAPALPLAPAPARTAGTRFTRRRHSLPAQLWDAVQVAGRRRGLTPSAVLMAAFAEVLRLWSRQAPCTLNLTLFNRPPVHPQIGEVIGDFTSLVLLAVDPAGRDTFTGRAAALQDQLMRDLQHLSYSGVRVLRERARRLGGQAAGMPVVFTSALGLTSDHRTGAAPATGAGMDFFGRYVHGVSQTPQVWLDHQVMEEQGRLVYNWDVVEELFPPGLIDDMLAAYRDVLQRLAADEAAWDGTAPLAVPPGRQLEERRSVNATGGEVDDRTLCGLFEEQVRRRPDAVAVLHDDGSTTYRALAERARQLARRLRALGAGPGQLVGVVLGRGPDMVAAVLGVTMAGAAYLPLDPQWPRARRDLLLARAGARVVVSDPDADPDADADWPDGTSLVTFADVAVTGADSSPLPSGPCADDVAYVIFTSGSTGEPKGVVVDHRGAVNTLLDVNERFAVTPDDRVLALSSLSFDLSVYDVFGLLAAGGAVVLPTAAEARDPGSWTALLRRHRVTVWNSVPALLQAWLDADDAGSPRADVAAPDAPVLRLALLSGDWISTALPDALRTRCPDTRVVSLGGATEASIWSVGYEVGEVPQSWSRIPYGTPLRNQTLHVYGPDGQPCPVWATGEIHIGGVGVARGYWADEQRTAERFVTHPGTGERLYRTGDLGRYLPGGDIDLLGREDLQVKLNGYRIELDEVGAALRRQPGVAEAVVTVAEHPGSGRRQLVAYVVPSRPAATAGARPDDPAWATLRAAGKDELARALVELAPELDDFGALWRELESVSPSLMLRTLSRLGVLGAAGDTVTADQVMERSGAAPGRRVLVSQWLGTLAAAGPLRETGRPGEYRCASGLDAPALEDQVARRLGALRCTEAHRPLRDYFLRCAARQVELLRGQVDPLELLLPGGSWETTDVLYATNPVSALQNRVAARVVSEHVRGCGSRPVRLLEIGGGTGATTAQVLPGLAGADVGYRFTDVSSSFLERARHRFAAHPFVEYGVYDVDCDPGSQGVAPGTFDVVVAANVLHDAHDLGRSLAHVRSLLAPGGILLLVEGTVNSAVQTVTVGFLEGFTHHEGRDALPLLSAPAWRERLSGADFHRTATFPEVGAATDVMVQHVLVSQVDTVAGPIAGDGLRRALEEVLPEYMVPHHYVVLDGLPLSGNGKVDHRGLPAAWAAAGEVDPVAPRNDVEQRLLDIWVEALGRDDFGVEDNFFELGGDSLHAVQILARLREEFDVGGAEQEEGLGRLFDNPTVAELAAAVSFRAAA